ncbi:uncharacterized oxidoreductase MexAM1_META1p0182-like [Oppia nitens]|uniref:uncharacterized oxidoreductase MexAM1_META1p0182-like n=1 Tax=Oppia nitens TaxID=1686743 RepID=UPI0023DC5D3B|nr:uncharacterized oxidoreductase MexAM1_META1p0182-like [Oppia nitens]
MSVNYDFTGKVVLVTGSSSGIGAATALLFAQSGANVVVTGRNADGVRKVAKQCTDESPKQLKPLEVVGDLTNESDCDRLIHSTVQKFGKLDVLVNNVGIAIRTDVYKQDFYENYKNLMQTNLNSVVYLTHKCVEHLAKTNGNIINISSNVSHMSAGNSVSAYNMSKAALDMFTKCMAAELGPKRIRVNSVNPGIVMSNFVTRMGVPEAIVHKIHDAIGAKYPVGRSGEGRDIANTVAYLASDTAAGFMTGSIVVADGGHLAANLSFEGESQQVLSQLK